MNSIRVFISYSHDSEEHRARVLALSERLRVDGIETILDQYLTGAPAGGWPRWMLDSLDAASYVLVVCTETYYRRFRGHEEPGKGKGVDWEGALITQEIYDARSRSLKFVPVFLESALDKWIPEPMRSINHYALISEEAYESLYDFLLGQAGVEARPVGELKRKPRKTGTPLQFAAPSPAVRPIDVSRILKYAPDKLIGREAEMALLRDAWVKAQGGDAARPRVLSFVALGGEGKTSLVARWVADLAAQDWPGCEAVFAWSFYSQGTRDQSAASSDLFLAEALRFFGEEEMAASAQSGFDKGRRLAQVIGRRRALLILDGLEPLQYAPGPPMDGRLKDDGIAELLKGLAANSHGLCVVTTRYKIPDLNNYLQTTAPMHELPRLSKTAGVALLEAIGVTGPQNEFESLVEEVHGHALTLQIMGQYLVRAHHGDIRRRDRVDFAKADERIQGGHAFRAMEAYVTWLENDSEESRRELATLRLLGLFDRPATAECIEVLRRAPAIPGLTEPLVDLEEDDWEFMLSTLREAKLLTVHREDGAGTLLALDAHPLLREYFAARFRAMDAQAGSTAEAWRAAHRRLYEHLCESTVDKPDATLEDLQPLYQAVAHGCHAGLHQEVCDKVYWNRILRGQEFYSTKKLGAFGADLGAVACFFDTPWRRVSPALTEVWQAWLLSQAAFRLRALGRLTEALEPMRAGLENYVKQENWKAAAITAGNLSQLELTLGAVAAAVEDAARSVEYADRSGDAFQRMARRTTHADALHQAGRRAEAEALFREAERMQAEDQPSYPPLYSLPGFRYCDLLLTEAERKSSNAECGPSNADCGLRNADLVAACRAVSERAAKIQQRRNGLPTYSLLDIALDHLTLGRAALYTAILEQSAIHNPQSAIESAVSGLRRAGTQDHLPRGLLTRAWLRSLQGAQIGPDSAQADLDEAWEIAVRGPMKLHMADIHLTRARLFGLRPEPYPWDAAATDLAAAERLIRECGYHRRDGELADIKRAILGTK